MFKSSFSFVIHIFLVNARNAVLLFCNYISLRFIMKSRSGIGNRKKLGGVLYYLSSSIVRREEWYRQKSNSRVWKIPVKKLQTISPLPYFIQFLVSAAGPLMDYYKHRFFYTFRNVMYIHIIILLLLILLWTHILDLSVAKVVFIIVRVHRQP